MYLLLYHITGAPSRKRYEMRDLTDFLADFAALVVLVNSSLKD